MSLRGQIRTSLDTWLRSGAKFSRRKLNRYQSNERRRWSQRTDRDRRPVKCPAQWRSGRDSSRDGPRSTHDSPP